MTASLLSNRFLFRFSVPCRYRAPVWEPGSEGLDETYRLPSFAELEDKPLWADVRAAWSEDGLAFSVIVSGKKQDPWCRTTRPENSDSVQIWIDTRDVHNIHRATRFCHRFLFMPTGGGRRMDKPVAQWLPIHRARGQPQAIRPEDLKVQSRHEPDGYRLDAFIADKMPTLCTAACPPYHLVFVVGGTSAEAQYHLEKGRLRTVLSDAVFAAYLRTEELGRELEEQTANDD